MNFETGLSTLNISRVKRARNTINFVDIRLVLVFLATVLQSLFNLFNAASLGKTSASKRVKTSHPHTENNQVNRICKFVWVEIRHKDQINVCRENQRLR